MPEDEKKIELGAQPSRSPAATAAPDGPRIMIVDDVFFNVDILKDVMRKVLKIDVKRYVVEAYNGKQALKAYAKLLKKYGAACPVELIMMDIDMPVMNGCEATSKILRLAAKYQKKLAAEGKS